jgi:hypothetical protein
MEEPFDNNVYTQKLCEAEKVKRLASAAAMPGAGKIYSRTNAPCDSG